MMPKPLFMAQQLLVALYGLPEDDVIASKPSQAVMEVQDNKKYGDKKKVAPKQDVRVLLEIACTQSRQNLNHLSAGFI